MSRRKVYVPNQSFHDFSDAKRYGELVFLTKGLVNRFQVNHMYREIDEALADAQPEDFLVVSSLSILNAVAASILAYRFGRVNFLIFNDGSYTPREIVLSQGDEPDDTAML